MSSVTVDEVVIYGGIALAFFLLCLLAEWMQEPNE